MIQSENEHDQPKATLKSFGLSGRDSSVADELARYNAATLAFATQVVIDCGVPQMLQLPSASSDAHNPAVETRAVIDRPEPPAAPVRKLDSVVTSSPEPTPAPKLRKLTSPRSLNRIAPRKDEKTNRWKAKLERQREKRKAAEAAEAAAQQLRATTSETSSSRPMKGETKHAVAEANDDTSRSHETDCAVRRKTPQKKLSQPAKSETAAVLAFAAIATENAASHSITNRTARRDKSPIGKSSLAKQPGSPTFAELLSGPEQSFKTDSPFLVASGAKAAEPKKPHSRSKKSEKTTSIATTAIADSNDLDSDFGSKPFRLAEPAPREEEPYSEWFKRVVVRNRWATWFTTFYVHWLILLALTAIIVHGPENAANLLINATMADYDEIETPVFDVEVPDLQPEPEPTPNSEPVKEEAQPLEEKSVPLDQNVMDKLSPDSSAPAAAEGEPTESQPKPRAANPAPAMAVSKGSFSVWTEPTQPTAGEPYRIIIQVCLPDGVVKYNIADLEGVVVGSDGYRKPIAGFLRGFLPVEGGYARLIVPIVRADAKVKDTVYIRSKLLKEAQQLLIEF